MGLFRKTVVEKATQKKVGKQHRAGDVRAAESFIKYKVKYLARLLPIVHMKRIKKRIASSHAWMHNNI